MFNFMSQFDRIWCLQYDEDSYHRPMVKVKFAKYLNTILSNQYYAAFQAQAYKELHDENQWNQRCWALLQMFQYFNSAFAINQFQSNVKFIADKNTRKLFGSFRMWIDLQRLYLLSYLKMDRIQFQQDRIYFALYRTFFFLHDLLSQYQVSDFKRPFLQKISAEITKHTKKLQMTLPAAMHIMLKCIRQMIPNYIIKEPLVDFKEKDDVKKTTFRKLSRSYDMMPEIVQRLNNNIQFQTKVRQVREISDIAESPQIQAMTREVEHLYDPKVRIAEAVKKQSEATNKPYDQKRFNDMLSNYRNKMKEKPTTETPYQSLMRAGHNPYDESNYAIYGEALGVDMSQKQHLEKKQELKQIEEEPENEIAIFYDPHYLQNIQKMQINSVAVTYKDLNNKAVQNDRQKHYSQNDILPYLSQFFIFINFNRSLTEQARSEQDNSILLTNLQWNQLKNNNHRNKRDYDNEDSDNDEDKNLSTIRSMNDKKNLQNNALFQKHEDQDKQKSMYIVKKAFRGGLDSDLLYGLDRKAEGIFDQMDSSKLVSLKTRAFLDRSKFDSLRKVAQFHSINRKISNWIKLDKIPAYYPRGIDQIRRFYVDTNIQNKKNELALEMIIQ